MKMLFVNQRIMVSIFSVILLIYGVQGISYGQDKAPTLTPGETNTSLIVRFSDFFNKREQKAHQVQLRRKSPQGEWITICKSRINNSTEPCAVFHSCDTAATLTITAIFTDLEPGTIYEARYRDTNQSECIENPPAPDLWSEIGEGSTRLVGLPRAEFVDARLARIVRRLLGLNTAGGHIELLKIPKAKLAKLTKLERPSFPSRSTIFSDDIINLTGLEHATQLITLNLEDNQISDITPLAQLTQLITLNLEDNQISDITPLAQLTQLITLNLEDNQISDITPLAQLTQLITLRLSYNNIHDITPLAQLTQLTTLGLSGNNIHDITRLAELANSPLTWLYLSGNQISDITPLAQLTQLTTLRLSYNNIRDVTPLTQLTQLKRLYLSDNPISDTYPLNTLLNANPQIDIDIEVIKEKGGPTITTSTLQPLTGATLDGARVTLTLSSGEFENRFDIRKALTISGIPGIGIAKWSEIEWSYSNRKEIEIKLTFSGDNIGSDSVLTLTVGSGAIDNYNGPARTLQLPVTATTEAELAELSKALVASTDYPLTATTLNGAVVTLRLTSGVYESDIFYQTRYLSAVKISGIEGITFGVYDDYLDWDENDVNRVSDTEITFELAFSGTINADATLTFTVESEVIAGYNGPARTAEIPVSSSAETVFGEHRTAFESSTPVGYNRVILSDKGQVYGVPTKYRDNSHPGTVAYMLLAKLKGCDFATAEVTRQSKVYIKTQALEQLRNFASETVCGVTSSTRPLWYGARITHLRFFDESSPSNINEAIYNTSTGQYELTLISSQAISPTPDLVVSKDVNDDGVVDVQDLVYVAQRYGQTGTTTADVNDDGIVNIDDLILVAAVLDADAAAPSLHSDALDLFTVGDVKLWLSQAHQRDLTDPSVRRGILFLEQLLAALIPKETALLANYPNPFNPETWIPYHLAKASDVQITIYDARGVVVRLLDLGHQREGYYINRSRAAHWDGRNAIGERVATGIYFYQLQADNMSLLRKMVILK